MHERCMCTRQLKTVVEEHLVDNPRDDAGYHQKITLTLGSGEL